MGPGDTGLTVPTGSRGQTPHSSAKIQFGVEPSGCTAVPSESDSEPDGSKGVRQPVHVQPSSPCSHVHMRVVTYAPLTHISPLPETQLGCRPALRVRPRDRRPVHLPTHPHLAPPKAQPSQGALTRLAACLQDNSGRQLLCNCSLVSGFWPLELGESVPAVLDYPASGHMSRKPAGRVEKDTSPSPQGDQSVRTEGRHVDQGVSLPSRRPLCLSGGTAH